MKFQKRHGMRFTKENSVWRTMCNRCSNPNHGSYKHYGAKGITVCERWRSDFMNFFNDMGPIPTPEHTIDRIDSKGNYEPGNCRWATNDIQQNNRSNNHKIEFRGDVKNLAQWCREFNMDESTFTNRIKRGMTVETALTKPVQKKRFYD